jgi:hypothetical protein
MDGCDPNVFDLNHPDGLTAYSTGCHSTTITFPDGLRWRIPFMTKVRWHLDLIWREGWAAWWSTEPWWLAAEVSVVL